MPAGFEARRGDGIHAGLLKGRGFIGCRRGADRDDAVRPALFQDVSCRDAEEAPVIAKGFDVRERICAITSLIASGAMLCAPNEPSPPKFETDAVSLSDDNPPSGP